MKTHAMFRVTSAVRLASTLERIDAPSACRLFSLQIYACLGNHQTPTNLKLQQQHHLKSNEVRQLKAAKPEPKLLAALGSSLFPLLEQNRIL